MKLVQKNLFGNPYIGCFCLATEDFALVPLETPEDFIKEVERALKVSVIKCKIADSNLIGIFAAANSYAIFLPRICEDEEEKKLKEELDVEIKRFNVKYTAIGNLLLLNDNGIVASPLIAKHTKKFAELLNLKFSSTTIANNSLVGSSGMATKRGAVVNIDITEDERKIVEDTLDVKAMPCTANHGKPFIGACMIANSKGAIIGELTTSIEISKIYQALT